MPNIRQVRRRIRTVQNAAKITRAMEMIAASKMRRAQQLVLSGRPYAERIQDLLAHLAAQPQQEEALHPLLQRREVKNIEIVHITPDRGLCGGLVSNINRRTLQYILERQVPANLITIGRKGRDFMVRYGRSVRAVFTDLGDRPSLIDVTPISHLVMKDYEEGLIDQVFLAYAQFGTTTMQRPIVQQLLPVEPAELRPEEAVGYIYEPEPRPVLEALLPRFVEMQVYHAVLESIASEQSARMVAMRNATENANEMIQNLTLEMNKVRQDTITRELLDIVGGVVALEA